MTVPHEFGEKWGYGIIGSETHPLKKAFELYCEMKKEQEEESEEEVVRCVCPDCYAEGKCMVSKRRAKELEKQNLMEECCPWGDECTAENSDEEEESDEDA